MNTVFIVLAVRPIFYIDLLVLHKGMNCLCKALQFHVLLLQLVAMVAHLLHIGKKKFCRVFVLARLFAVQLADYIVVVVRKLLHTLHQLHVLCLQVGYYT